MKMIFFFRESFPAVLSHLNEFVSCLSFFIAPKNIYAKNEKKENDFW